ncbi:MAG: heme-binding protein [Verrucomicrobia bacterium]|nr:heme-binding protein [Verrucomicrobiota bacterium]
MIRRMLLVAGTLLVVGLVWSGCAMTRAGYESAPYTVLEKSGRIELRRYPILRVAETPRGGDDFMRLFRYISKGNAAGEKIAMTTPVFMEGDGGTNETMAFVLPESLTAPPAPSNGRVSIRELPPSTFAVLRFKGGQQGPDGKAAAELRRWMADRKLPVGGEARFAYFDPPWIPGFLRRNEVMIPTPESTR